MTLFKKHPNQNQTKTSSRLPRKMAVTGSLRALGAELGVGVGTTQRCLERKLWNRTQVGVGTWRVAEELSEGPRALEPWLRWRATTELVPPCVARRGSPDAGGRRGGRTGTPLTGSGLGSHSGFGGLSATGPTARSHQSPESFLSNRLRKGYEAEVQGRSFIGLKRLELWSPKYPMV